MRQQLVITFDAYDFIGILDDHWALAMSVLGRQRLLELIANSLCYPIYGDDEVELEEAVLMALGYAGFNFNRVEDADKIVAFIKERLRCLNNIVPLEGWIELKCVTWQERSDTIYLVGVLYDD